MQTLDDLDKEAKSDPQEVQGILSLRDWKMEQRRENNSLAAGCCPKCPSTKISRDVSSYDQDIIYYSCDNKEKHIFIRFPHNDPRRIG